MNTDILKVPSISGIDAIYYFAQSGGFYDKFYENILHQIETKQKEFETLDYAYQESDIVIFINDIEIQYSGKGRDGFLWFNHKFFRVGFKDESKNANIHNIRVQLNAIGIYTIGITSLIDYINKVFLNGAILKENYFPITRIDVNMFVQHNFDYLTKNMLVSKKKSNESIISEHANGYALETFSVGKNPFKLRIYNKLAELKTASETKRDLMYNYFGINGLDIEKPIFNVEFELHREFLKQYGIDTVEDALKRSQKLFELSCELIRFIDPSTLSNKQLNSSNRRRADTLPVWKYISTHYENNEFMQLATPLNKIDKITYRYSLEDAKKSLKRVTKRLLLHNSTPTLFFFLEVLQEAKHEFTLAQNMKQLQSDTPSIEPKFEKEDLSAYSDEGLIRYEDSLAFSMKSEEYGSENYYEIAILYNDVYEELVRRGLVQPIPF